MESLTEFVAAAQATAAVVAARHSVLLYFGYCIWKIRIRDK